jgi:amino acid transporter
VPIFSQRLKSFLLGKPLSSRQFAKTELPKRIALPVFASDALSSVAYAPDEILITLGIAGTGALIFAPWIGIGVVAVLAVVVLSYCQNVHAYPSGGGDFEVVSSNLGSNAGLLVGASLFVDYILTVAVSISSGTNYLISMLPDLYPHKTWIAIGIIVLIGAISLRGSKSSGNFFSIPVYTFIACTLVLILVGLFQYFTGSLDLAPSASLNIAPEAEFSNGIIGFGAVALFSRAFASGNTALTGIEAISNGVPIFREPKSSNAAKTLLTLGAISAFMLLSILFLSAQTEVRYLEPTSIASTGGVQTVDSAISSSAAAEAAQTPAIGQLAQTVFAGAPLIFYIVSIATGLILFLAANTAFNGMPTLMAILAERNYLPHYLKTRGSRLSLSNGIMFLSLIASAVVWIFQANVTSLVQLYVVGVFLSFSLSQLSMIIHWNRVKRQPDSAAKPRLIWAKKLVSVVGFILTTAVLIIIVINKFTHGAWITLVLIGVLFWLMKTIHSDYQETRSRLDFSANELKKHPKDRLASKKDIRAVVLVARLDRPTLRALTYARLSRPAHLDALHMMENEAESSQLSLDWQKANVGVHLIIRDNPYRDITANVVKFIKITKNQYPDQLLAIYIPDYKPVHFWDWILYNHIARRLREALLDIPGVAIVTVSWPLDSDFLQDDSSLNNQP